MNGNNRQWVLQLIVLVVTAGMLGAVAPVADAAVGDILKSVDLPAGALCGTDSGSALAVVSGGKVGLPQFPILIVTSCGGKIFFLDPSTSPATLAKTLTTSVTPSAGWGGLVLRPDHGDLLACTQTSSSKTALYAIDINPFNSVADGTATSLRNGPSGTTCGIAWDVSTDGLADGTIYQTPSSGSSIFHYAPTGTGTLTSITGGCSTTVSAVSIAGTSLFLGCPPSSGGGKPTIRQLDKAITSGSLVRSFDGPSSLTLPVGLADDPGTFSAQFKEILWTKDKAASSLRAVEIPGGTLGQKLGPPALFPAACPATYPTAADGSPLDTDGDGLLDCWEDGSLWSDGLPGLSFTGNWTGNPADRDLTLCVDANANGNFGLAGSAERNAECASPLRKDIFAEMDYMHYHDPRVSAAAMLCDPSVSASCDVNSSVVLVFANAPVTNPDGSTGIRLHLLIDEEIPHTNATALVPCTPAPASGDATFDNLKFGVNTGTVVKGYFGTATERGNARTINAKYFTFHYGLWVHNQSGSGNTSSGCAEIGGNDFIVSLGSYGVFDFGTATTHDFHNVGTPDQQAGTWLHEFGHNLGLRHGGGDDVNCKPNYESVMSYARQTAGPISPRIPLDYSRQKLPTLNKTNLNEASGLGTPIDGSPAFAGQITFGPQVCQDVFCFTLAASVVNVASTSPVDWNRNGLTTDVVSQDVNNLGIPGCPASSPSSVQTLDGYNDWANIKLNFRASVDFGDGARVGIIESKTQGNLDLTFDESLVLTRDRIDFKPSDPNNTVLVHSTQSVPVTIFSRGGDGALDATDLNPATTTLRATDGFTWVVPVKQTPQGAFLCTVIDVNKDGLPDLVCQFDLPKNAISTSEKRVVLEGITFSGQPVLGSDFLTPKGDQQPRHKGGTP